MVAFRSRFEAMDRKGRRILPGLPAGERLRLKSGERHILDVDLKLIP